MPHIIVVADSTRARIFSRDTVKLPLKEIETMAHPEGRMHERDMVSDLPGKVAGKGGAGDHTTEDKVKPKEQEVIEFAKRIADYLDAARKANKLNHLYIISPPAFLGELRSQLNSETAAKIALEVNKNLTQHSVEDISNHLSA